jgi:hypothetical protein
VATRLRNASHSGVLPADLQTKTTPLIPGWAEGLQAVESTENSVRIDYVTESPNVSGDDRQIGHQVASLSRLSSPYAESNFRYSGEVSYVVPRSEDIDLK